jgi:hypothetical protein
MNVLLRILRGNSGNHTISHTRHVIAAGLLVVFVFLAFCLFPHSAHATIYFYYDAENGTVGDDVPMDTGGVYFEFTTTPDSTRGTVRNAPLVAKQGTKYFGFDIAANQHDAQADIRNRATMPFNTTLGTTYYLAYFLNFTEINNIEVFRTNISTQECAEKGVEMVGNGLRWIVSMGSRWSEQNLSAHQWSPFLGNPSHHLNPTLESYDAFLPNQSGYNINNWPKMTSGQWYGVVLAVRMAQNNTGSVAYYVDGVKITEHLNIMTVATGVTPTIDRITMNGTICQNDYNTSAHVKNYDALILTDNWQDIVNGGYLNNGSLPPAAPQGLLVQ